MKKSELKKIIKECLKESGFDRRNPDLSKDNIGSSSYGDAEIEASREAEAEEKEDDDSLDEPLEEITGTGAVAGYNTPFAFGSNKKKTKETAEQLGYKLVNEKEEILSEARYHNFRNHPMKEHAKLSLCLREVKKMLREIDFLTNISDKLKLEAGVDANSYWGTIKERDIPEIYARLKEIQNKLNRLTEKRIK